LVEKENLLVTADVSSLYPSIPTTAGLRALRSALDSRPRQVPPTEAIIRLAELVLNCNHFTFNGRYYTQTSGTAMGTRFAPNYAIVFMDEFERGLLEAADLKPTCWFRYIDDIFFVWPHGENTLKPFMEYCNARDPAIQLTFEYSRESVSFLDVSVTTENGTLITDLYRKPTDTMQYLPFASCHPTEQKLPIAYSQALRIRRICSKKSDAIRHCVDLRNALIRLGYPRKACSRQIGKALRADRETLIRPKDQDAKDKDPIKMFLPFHPNVSSVPDILRSRLHLLQDHRISMKVYWKPPSRFKDLLVGSMLREPTEHRAPGNVQLGRQGTTKCGVKNCGTCDMVYQGSSIRSSKTGLSYHLPPATCSTENVIYMLTFTNCDKQYIGQTGQKLKRRMNLYRSNYNLKKTDQPVVHHMRGGDNHPHKFEDLRVTVLEVTTRDQLASREFFWISQMMTDHPFGLNVQNVLYRNCYSMQYLAH
jgi:hypothetical protein